MMESEGVVHYSIIVHVWDVTIYIDIVNAYVLPVSSGVIDVIG